MPWPRTAGAASKPAWMTISPNPSPWSGSPRSSKASPLSRRSLNHIVDALPPRLRGEGLSLSSCYNILLMLRSTLLLCALAWLSAAQEPIAPHSAIEPPAAKDAASLTARSEEHTSELQSLRHLVC